MYQLSIYPAAQGFYPEVPCQYRKGLANQRFVPKHSYSPGHSATVPYLYEGQPDLYDGSFCYNVHALPHCYVVEQPTTVFGYDTLQTSTNLYAGRPHHFDGQDSFDPRACQPRPLLVQPSFVIGDASPQSQERTYCVSAIDGGSFANLVCVGSPETLLLFLHDNRHRLPEMRSLSLQYRFFYEPVPFAGWDGEMAPYTGPTNLHAWRILWNVLTHWYTGLTEITVNLSGEFWELAPWWRGSKACFETLDLCQSHLDPCDQSPFSDEKRNFLEHIARVSGEKIVKIEIEGAHESDERMSFQTNLNDWADNLRTYRKWFATCTGCLCAAGCSLEDSCFWRNDGW